MFCNIFVVLHRPYPAGCPLDLATNYDDCTYTAFKVLVLPPVLHYSESLISSAIREPSSVTASLISPLDYKRHSSLNYSEMLEELELGSPLLEHLISFLSGVASRFSHRNLGFSSFTWCTYFSKPLGLLLHCLPQ